MQRALLAALVASAVALPSAAMAAVVFDSVGDTGTVTLGGDQPGTSSTLFLTLTELQPDGDFVFSYTVTNLSDTSQNPQGRVSGFGFSTSVDLNSGAGNQNGVTGDYTNFELNPPPGQLGDVVDICFANGGACSGSGGATVGDPATGTLTLDFASGTGAVTLDDFGVRYQSLGPNGEGSGRGFENGVPAVPEPGTWAMMLLGFGAIGFAMRRRRSGALAQQLA